MTEPQRYRSLALLRWLPVVLACMLGGCATDRRPTSTSSADTLTVVHSWTIEPVVRKDVPSRTTQLEAVQASELPSFDRIVFSFRDQLPRAYDVQYLDAPLRQCGSGKPFDVAGGATLEVRFIGTRAHTELGASTLKSRALILDQPAMKEAAIACDFEGYVVWGIGLPARSPYRVMVDTASVQFVIDVRH